MGAVTKVLSDCTRPSGANTAQTTVHGHRRSSLCQPATAPVIMSSQISDTESNWVRTEHPELWADDANVFIRVSSDHSFDRSVVQLALSFRSRRQVFAVHRSQLRRSQIFETLFTLPVKSPKPKEGNEMDGDRGPLEGSCEENPIFLDGILSSDFTSLLLKIYGL